MKLLKKVRISKTNNTASKVSFKDILLTRIPAITADIKMATESDLNPERTPRKTSIIIAGNANFFEYETINKAADTVANPWNSALAGVTAVLSRIVDSKMGIPLKSITMEEITANTPAKRARIFKLFNLFEIYQRRTI